MQNSITATVNAAQNAARTLAATIHAAADQIQALDTSEVQEALERLARATLDARARLDALRSHAEGILGSAFQSFASFEDEVTEPVSAPALPAPEPTPAPVPEAIAFTPARPAGPPVITFSEEPATTTVPEPTPEPEPVQTCTACGCRDSYIGPDGRCDFCPPASEETTESEPVAVTAASGPEPSTNGRPARKGGGRKRR